MRTTITLAPDVDALVQKMMKDRGLTFKEAVNDALRQALGAPATGTRFATPTFTLGAPSRSLDKALQLAGDLDDAEIARELDLRK